MRNYPSQVTVRTIKSQFKFPWSRGTFQKNQEMFQLLKISKENWAPLQMCLISVIKISKSAPNWQINRYFWSWYTLLFAYKKAIWSYQVQESLSSNFFSKVKVKKNSSKSKRHRSPDGIPSVTDGPHRIQQPCNYHSPSQRPTTKQPQRQGS